MSARDAATEAQVRAARPDASTWLSANAGSGKTRVLTDRVARLLLAGVQPQNILCLTYTKAAASEMQNRLFRRLGAWAMLDDSPLAAALTELGVEGAITSERMRHARTLFARAIEAPGGLKIQTIHSFCASLLRRFPLEAGVSPQFSEMEDRAARLLRDQIVEDMVSGPHCDVVDGIVRHVSENDLQTVTKAVAGNRNAFAAPLDRDGALALFGLPAGFDDAALESEVFLGGEAEDLAALIPILEASSPNDIKAAAKLAQISGTDHRCLAVLENVFLNQTGKAAGAAKLGSFPTKPVREAHPDLMARIEPLMQRVEAARPRRLGLLAAEKTLALHHFAAVFLAEYARRKQERGWLDFDDQIDKARQLLIDTSVAAWVLYRLDGGIDHILVDEAQDTSPEQWEVIERLAQEFTSGEGARAGVERTIFVVGDKKQSIYSFQGADPGAFDRMQAEFGRRLEQTGTGLANLTLEFSFRSAGSILALVDQAFAGQTAAGFPAGGQHRAFKHDLPGRIDLWPVVPRAEKEEPPHWSDPVDRLSPAHHDVILAREIAVRIKAMLDAGETIPDGKIGEMFRRPVRAGDFLILVRRRSTLFGEIIRACKDIGLPMAGSDRLKVGAELAVRDLGALLSFLATPEDDLALATALKSPLFGWSEQALFTLAHGRGEAFLWEVLRERAADHGETLAMIHDLRDQVDFLRPFDLIERILNRHRGRDRLLGRLGPEAEDGIDALLSQALAYERTEVPSLTGFLGWMETDDLEIKRQIGSNANVIRVMTVHGAKGLEAPIVILPETAVYRPKNSREVLDAEGVPVWPPLADLMPDTLKPILDAAREKARQESLRLLYVALTRAEKWLIVAAAGDVEGKDAPSWYQIVEDAMHARGAIEHGFPTGPGLQIQDDEWDALPLIEALPEPASLPDLPAHFTRAAAPVVSAPVPLSPSDLGGAKALAGAGGDTEEAAKRHGTRVHLLLEHLPVLPAADWDRAAEALLHDASPDDAARAGAEARQVLEAGALRWLWAPETLAEVPITAEVGGQRIHGVIDRLIVTPDRIVAVDFKSNATVPETVAECPEGLLRQMGAYAAALQQVYPERRIEVAILWTRSGTLMSLPHDLVSISLGRTPHLDLPQAPT